MTLLVILAGGFVARTVFARITMNTIDSVGIVADKGRLVTVTGPIAAAAVPRVARRLASPIAWRERGGKALRRFDQTLYFWMFSRRVPI